MKLARHDCTRVHKYSLTHTEDKYKLIWPLLQKHRATRPREQRKTNTRRDCTHTHAYERERETHRVHNRGTRASARKPPMCSRYSCSVTKQSRDYAVSSWPSWRELKTSACRLIFYLAQLFVFYVSRLLERARAMSSHIHILAPALRQIIYSSTLVCRYLYYVGPRRTAVQQVEHCLRMHENGVSHLWGSCAEFLATSTSQNCSIVRLSMLSVGQTSLDIEAISIFIVFRRAGTDFSLFCCYVLPAIWRITVSEGIGM